MSEAIRRQAYRADLATRAYIVFVSVTLVASLVVLSFLAIQDHHRIQQNQEIQTFIKHQSVRNGQIGREIRDCTQPNGRCYQRAQRRTADAVASINKVAILAAACSIGVPPTLEVTQRQVAIQQCVIDRLASRR